MRQLIVAFGLALAGLLTACAPPPGPVGYRNMQVEMTSLAAVDLNRLAGDWHEVAGIYDPAQSGCAAGVSRIAPLAPGRVEITLAECAGVGARTVVARQERAAGRFKLDLPGRLGQPWWVLWTDEEGRVLVLGTPSGAFAAILSRGPQLSRSRLAAAKQVLALNGYDPKALRAPLR